MLTRTLDTTSTKIHKVNAEVIKVNVIRNKNSLNIKSTNHWITKRILVGSIITVTTVLGGKISRDSPCKDIFIRGGKRHVDYFSINHTIA